MNNTKSVTIAFLVGLSALMGCGPRKPVQFPKQVNPAPSFEVQASPGVAVSKASCGKGSPETCNGLDDDCNGVIDDHCGYEGGDLQITLSWNTGADIDLYVTDPGGDTLYYNQEHRNTSSGGCMDHDGRGDCRSEQSDPRIENVFWKAAPPRGEYKVELNYFGPCGDNEQTDTTVAVSVRGRLVGEYRYTLKPEERFTVLTLRMK
jgi:hypothetical protein